MTTIDVQVTVNDRPEQPLWARVVATAIVVGFVLWVLGLFWWVAGGVAVYAAVWWLWWEHQAATAERAAMAARADQQHAQIMAGDERGVYGDYPPARP
ncbi:Hypothetical protein MUW33_2782 [Mycobacterium canetti]|uniref:hypothetical protein n=1 Tax=Mycobacterium canetti TaxID=78331 RepID=UPI002D79D30C|nr:hypothetical protein [Mycobacterium canetti]WRO42732.1 Hypothetical protein MUW33_2782 [Mycobacterium canetti]